MKTVYYQILIGFLIVGVAFFSYLFYTYYYILNNIPPLEEIERNGFHNYICDLQRQLDYSECYVDGITIDFDDIDTSSPYFDD